MITVIFPAQGLVCPIASLLRCPSHLPGAFTLLHGGNLKRIWYPSTTISPIWKPQVGTGVPFLLARPTPSYRGHLRGLFWCGTAVTPSICWHCLLKLAADPPTFASSTPSDVSVWTPVHPSNLACSLFLIYPALYSTTWAPRAKSRRKNLKRSTIPHLHQHPRNVPCCWNSKDQSTVLKRFLLCNILHDWLLTNTQRAQRACLYRNPYFGIYRITLSSSDIGMEMHITANHMTLMLMFHRWQTGRIRSPKWQSFGTECSVMQYGTFDCFTTEADIWWSVGLSR